MPEISDRICQEHVPIDIYFTAVGIINVPDAEEIRTKPLRIA